MNATWIVVLFRHAKISDDNVDPHSAPMTSSMDDPTYMYRDSLPVEVLQLSNRVGARLAHCNCLHSAQCAMYLLIRDGSPWFGVLLFRATSFHKVADCVHIKG